MGEKSFISILIAFFFVFWGSLFLESGLSIFVLTELLFLSIALVVAAIILIALHAERKWAFPLATLFFSIMLVNLIMLFLANNHFTVFVVSGIFAVFGIVVATRSIAPPIVPYGHKDFETYEVPALAVHPEVEIITEHPGITKTPAAAVKKSAKTAKKAKAKKKSSRKKRR